MTAAAESLVVAGVFGPTFQGEGPSLGRRASFIRLGGCNLHCSWCDTPYTWDARRHNLREELTRRPVTDLVSEVAGHGTRLVVVTGGEPLLHQHQPGWEVLLRTLGLAGIEVEVETNGTIAPAGTTAWVTRFNVSPKLAHAGDDATARIRPAALHALVGTGRASFKFVCRSEADLREVQAMTDTIGIPARNVWIMPEGTRADVITARLRDLASPVKAAGFNLTTRLHVLAWGDQRGH